MLNASHAYEARRLLGGVDVEDARQHRRLVADDAHDAPVHAAKPHVIDMAQCRWTSKYSPSSTTALMIFFMS